VPKDVTFSMPVFADVRDSRGRLVQGLELHNSLEPAVLPVEPGTYTVFVESCGGHGRFSTTDRRLSIDGTMVVAIMFLSNRVHGRTVCTVRQFE
jgi:hypothetical protein